MEPQSPVAKKKNRSLHADVPIGWPVQFFHHGDRRNYPMPALVSRHNNNGGLDLVAFPPNGGIGIAVPTCRHMDDPVLKERPMMLTEGQWAGAWDFVPGMAYPLAGPAEDVQAALELLDESKKPSRKKELAAV